MDPIGVRGVSPFLVTFVTECETTMNNTTPILVSATESLSPTGRRGIEVRFSDKPTSSTIKSLKAYGFRWNPGKSVWWAYDSPTARTWATNRALSIRPLSEPRVSVADTVAVATVPVADRSPSLADKYPANSKVGRFLREHSPEEALRIFVEAADAAVKRGCKRMDNPVR